MIETMIRRTFGFEPQYINDYYDIPAEYNSEYGIPLSIKTTCTDVVYLADARRWWHNVEPLQLVVNRYASVAETTKKVWFETNTYVLNAEALRTLKGNVPSNVVELFHNDIHVFRPGEHAAARVLAKRRRDILERVYGASAVRLNAKIDSKNQRRLQCSLHVDALSPYLVRSDTRKYRGIHLPLILDMEKDVKK